MNKAEFAEIRAQLQASVAPERGRKPLFGALRNLLPAASLEPSHRKPAYPTPRRVGLRPAEPADVEAVEALLEEPSDAEAERRRAFGQRQDAGTDFLPLLLLTAPEEAARTGTSEDQALSALKRRRTLRLNAPTPVEAPYHPEDLSDSGEAHAEALYAEAGLFEPAAPAPTDVPEAKPEALPETKADAKAERALLERLEALFLTEQAGVLARLKA